MKEGRATHRIAALIMIAILLFWNVYPLVSFAGGFITPGKAIDYGKVMAPGKAIQGGKFIVPGQVYQPGTAMTPGEAAAGQPNSPSGQPILPASPSMIGTFIIPNATPIPSGAVYWQLRGLETGQAVKGGTANSGGKGSASGSALKGGGSVEGGNGPAGSQVLIDGQAATGGHPSANGTGMNGGQGPAGAQVIDGGKSSAEGTAANGGKLSADGTVPGSKPGQNTESGGNQGASGDGSPGGFFAQIHDVGKKAKKLFVTYPKKFGEILDGSLSIFAGFKITDLETASGNKNLYKILGKTTFTKVDAKNPLTMWLNLRYQNYLESFKESKLVLRNGILRSGTEVKAKKINKFFQSNTKFNTVLAKIGKDFSDNWNPFSNPFNPANKGLGKVFNKEFFKLSKVAKGSGLGNVLLATGGRIIDYATDSKKSFKSTDFAAGITTDVAFGVGSTAVSAGAGWLATAGAAAAFGSVIPGVGTAVGAIVGLGIGFFLESRRGKKIKGFVEKGIKKGFDWLVGKGSSIKKGLAGIFG